MDRPRIAAIVSGAAASTAAFFVVSRSSLLGTLTGAATISIIYAVVSYASTTGLERAGVWFKSRMSERPSGGRQQSDAEEDSENRVEDGVGVLPDAPKPALKTEVVASTKTEAGTDADAVTYYRTSGHRRLKPQWLLAGSVLVALATSIYAAASPPATETVEKLVLRTEVVEKTVTVTTEVESPDPGQSTDDALVANSSDADATGAGGGAGDGVTAGQTTEATDVAQVPDDDSGANDTPTDTPATDTSEDDQSSDGTSSATTVSGATGQPGQPEEPQEQGEPTESTTPTTLMTNPPGTDGGPEEGD